MPKTYVLDSAAVLNDVNFEFERGKSYYASSKIVAEMKDLRAKTLVENAIKQGILKVRDPCPLSVQAVYDKADELGHSRLSSADVSVIALAKELKEEGADVRVMTDDYSVQNILLVMGIAFRAVLMGEIREEKVFVKTCPNCSKTFEESYSQSRCDVCSTRLRKRPQKRAKTP